MTIYFTSDTHFGHANVIKYSNRPFPSKEEMDEAMIRNWNARVQPTDSIYHLGDFAFAQEPRIEAILSRLNGKKYLIYGNHDQVIKKSSALKGYFEFVRDYFELTVEDAEANRGLQKLCLFHYAQITWNKAHHGAWMLHGHSHHNLKYPFRGRIIDVGVDGKGYNYSPISYDEVKKKMLAVADPQYLDHHREE